MMKRVKRIFPLRSGTLKMFRTLDSTGKAPGQRRGRRPRSIGSAVGELVALHGGTPVAPGLGQDLHGTAGRRDGSLGRLREGVRLDRDLAGQLASPEDLDQRSLVGEPLALEGGRADLVEAALLDRVEVDGLVLDAEGVVEALQLGEAHVQRHLTALEG